MKKGNPFVKIVTAVLFCFVLAIAFSLYFGKEVVPFIAVAMILYAAIGNKNTVAYDGVYTEVWLGELVKRFRFSRTWLNLIPRHDQHVKNKVIHLVDVGADPNVYVDLVIDANNPVPTSTREDQDIPISLNRYDTENTRVSLTELRAISYDKMAVTLDLHMNAISDKAAKKAAYNLASTDDANIFATTGNSDGRAVAKKRLTPDDLIALSEKVLTDPDQGGQFGWAEGAGIAVLDHRHVGDLQKLDQKFENQWKNAQTGELLDYNGWKIVKFNNNALYTADGDGTYTRKAFGAAYDGANDLHSSFFMNPARAFAAADAAPEMFYRIAQQDPELRSNTVGFRHWNIVAKKKKDGFIQLVSPKI